MRKNTVWRIGRKSCGSARRADCRSKIIANRSALARTHTFIGKKDCGNHYRKCPFGRQCSADCPEYEPFRCSRRDRSPGACNGCSNWNYCRFDKYQYPPETAQSDYEKMLVDSREGVNLIFNEAKEMAAIIGPLLRQGQSPYQIITGGRNSPPRTVFRLMLTVYAEPGCFIVTQCSPVKKEVWRTSISNSDISFQKEPI